MTPFLRFGRSVPGGGQKERFKVRNFEGMGGISSALGRRNDNSCISAHADYRREDFVFSRTQSLAMRA
ncbi:MAG TPA: hypothetical protein VH000_10355, partial [Rhizomicrobium sp.]|nr:hypothetical protein [Rhizomicrobium sp.]